MSIEIENIKVLKRMIAYIAEKLSVLEGKNLNKPLSIVLQQLDNIVDKYQTANDNLNSD